MIKELSKSEIKEFEKRVEELRNIDEYKYFFTEEESKFDRVFDLDGYFATVNVYQDIPCLGVIKLENKGSLNSIIQIFRKLMKEYKLVVIWRYEDNKKLEKLHNRIKNKFEFFEEIKEKNKVIIIVGGAEKWAVETL